MLEAAGYAEAESAPLIVGSGNKIRFMPGTSALYLGLESKVYPNERIDYELLIYDLLMLYVRCHRLRSHADPICDRFDSELASEPTKTL